MRHSRDILILYTSPSLRVNLCHDKTRQEFHLRGTSAVYKKCFRSLWGRREVLVWGGPKAFTLPPFLSPYFFLFPFLNKSNADRGKAPCRKTDNKMTSSLEYRRKMRWEIFRRKFAPTVTACVTSRIVKFAFNFPSDSELNIFQKTRYDRKQLQ